MNAATPSRPRRRATNQQDDLARRALEIAAGNDARMDGHEDLCAERYRNTDRKIDEIHATQTQNHQDNREWMRGIEGKLDSLNTLRNQNDGKHLRDMNLKDWLIACAAIASVLYTIFHGR